ncbi:single-stranded-DNA-specific exonuclease [Pilibacter termitis]|uniref:Single-stranded-DNA-specific exonuclease RecJ n=1 Tax=Pilibacter termitis TaxID=263852 RepID=A0A1T4K3H1_9ENTE|nr:single-stranded-DNA-specific exonuclease RecJ [Pilibacter termitis]SJZ36949.1 single-stranded-DNA-specific exonuclease [Pilibacter termitis]
MKPAFYKWQVAKRQELPSEFLSLTEKEKLHPLVAQILFDRGIKTAEELEKFLHPTIESLHDPFLMYDMERAVARIMLAIERDEKILIYGDYDADGITSTTVMKEAIETLGAEPEYFLPNRFTDGYGPNLEVYKYYIQSQEISLIITVDNGVAGHEALKFAKEAGVDVIVTDHHELPDELPEAFAIVHPKHPEGNYPFQELAGVGVAFKVATALLGEIPMESLDLVAIGTIADLVRLTDENRTLVQLGLQMIKTAQRIGLDELLKVAGVEREKISETSIGFQIGPRLNALGRLGEASPGVELMSTFDEEEAQQLAEEIDAVNQERKKIVEDITNEVMAMVNENPQSSAYVFAKENWHEGVLGIVAGKVMNETGKPAVILTIKEDGITKGSARSIEAINIYELLNENRELFTAFGGHHAAAGMSLPKENVAKLSEVLNTSIEKSEIDLTQGQTLFIDEVLTPKEVTVEFIEQMNALAPFGTEFPEPYFLFKDVKFTDGKAIGANLAHLKGKIEQEEATLDCIYFSAGDKLNEFSTEEQNELVGKLSVNEWNGNKLPQLMVEDFQVNGLQVFDLRGKNNTIPLPFATGLFLSFDKKTVVPENAIFHLQTNEAQEIIQCIKEKKITEIIVLDTPTSIEILADILQETSVSRIFLVVNCPNEEYLQGMGTREQYAKLFGFIHQFHEVDVRHKSKEIAQYLKIPYSLFIFMLQVFEELGFVTIENGLLNEVEKPEKKALDTSKLYQERMKKIRIQEFFILNNIPEIAKKLTGKNLQVAL